ncbi:MAG: dihydrolipoyl dehydrogenase [Candidatus Latescibacterota bacterium]|nr:MAG: dihydrolipoyl dehydrogenase [Candidatus Latescibacterota bacterium]
MTKKVQLVVIGAGPGGYAAAFLAADLGMDVVLVDKEPNPGGVCLYRGCIPSKALLHVAKLMSEVEDAKKMGVDYPEPSIDRDKLRSWKTSVVDRLTGGLGQLSKRRNIRYVRGTATFRDGHSIEIAKSDGSNETITFEHAIIATGSRPSVVPALDLKSPRVLDSTSALDLESIPETLLVVGGGYIGLELGSVYAALGSKVSVVEMLPGILPGADRDMVNVLKKRLEQKFEAIMTNTTVASMAERDEKITVTFDGDNTGDARFDKVLVSIGRKPNTEDIGLETTKVKVGQRGFIDVDAQLRTNEPAVFAIGDVVGEPMLAHKASHEGRTAVEVIAGHKVAFEPQAIPAVIFTDPEIAWAGLTQSEAKEKGIDVEVAKFPWAASGRALTLERTDGMTKLLIEPKSNRLLGVAVVGAGAGELIAEGVLAIEMGANATDLKLTIHPHPTLSETLMEAAEVFFGQSTHVHRPRRK